MRAPRSDLITLQILAGTDTGNTPEGAGEVRGIGITQQVGNIGNGIIRIL